VARTRGGRVASPALLLLFDIDGTLVRSRPLNHQIALTEATQEVFGLRVAPGEDPVRDAEPWGKTDRQILRDVLANAGLDANPAPEEVARWERVACRVYERLETAEDRSAENGRTADTLERLAAAGHRLALVTGNLERIARRKLERRGLADWFPAGQGGFGSDADLRPALVPIARERAGGCPRADTLLIGDTPNDVAAALADDVRCVGVSGPRFSRQDLLAAGAVDVIDEVPALEGLLARL
jgi:phosphoglycolate phosphatase-like HAD superfamily hydrolase